MRLRYRFVPFTELTLKNSFGDFDTAAAHRRVASNAASHALVTAQMVMQFLMQPAVSRCDRRAAGSSALIGFQWVLHAAPIFDCEFVCNSSWG